MRGLAQTIVVCAALLFGQAQFTDHPKAERDRFPSIPQKLIHSSVKINRMRGNGSGVYLGNRWILTAYHVVKGAGPIRAHFSTSEHKASVEIDCKIVHVDKSWDLALLEVEDVPYFARGARLGKDNPVVGDPLIIIGAPVGVSDKTATVGFFAGSKGQWWQTSNAVFFGNSGGGVYSANDERLVGICVKGIGSMFSMAPNIALIVPLPEIKRFLKNAERKR